MKAFHTEADVDAIVSRLKAAFPGAEFHSVYEAGFSGFHTHRALEAAGFRVACWPSVRWAAFSWASGLLRAISVQQGAKLRRRPPAGTTRG